MGNRARKQVAAAIYAEAQVDRLYVDVHGVTANGKKLRDLLVSVPQNEKL